MCTLAASVSGVITPVARMRAPVGPAPLMRVIVTDCASKSTLPERSLNRYGNGVNAAEPFANASVPEITGSGRALSTGAA